MRTGERVAIKVRSWKTGIQVERVHMLLDVRSVYLWVALDQRLIHARLDTGDQCTAPPEALGTC